MELSERQQQIIEASIGLIDRLGIQGFTIKNLSKEIGISEPAIYRHFESKVEILGTILESFRQQVKHYHDQGPDQDAQDPREAIEQFFTMVFRVFSQNPTMVSVIFAEEIFRNEPALTRKVTEIQHFNEEVLTALIEKLPLNENVSGQSKGFVTMMFFGSVRLLVRKWRMSESGFDLQREGKKLIETILNLITV
ncbi:MAG: TetR/AcrR family transcriptional regulator [Marinilabiliaceae bacterium]